MITLMEHETKYPSEDLWKNLWLIPSKVKGQNFSDTWWMKVLKGLESEQAGMGILCKAGKPVR